MTDAEKWGLILGTIVVVAVVIFIIGVLIQIRQRRSERVLSAIETVDKFSQAANRVPRITDPNSRQTAARVLAAERDEMDEMVPDPQAPEPNLNGWN